MSLKVYEERYSVALEALRAIKNELSTKQQWFKKKSEE
jgi:hypothetical protein